MSSQRLPGRSRMLADVDLQGWEPPARLIMILRYAAKIRKRLGYEDPTVSFEDSYRTVPNPSWRFLAAANTIHRVTHDRRRVWWHRRARRSFSAFGAALGLTLLSSPLAWLGVWHVPLLMALTMFVFVTITGVYYIIGEVDGLMVHRSDLNGRSLGIVECLGGPGVLPAWVGGLLAFPAALNPTDDVNDLRTLIGFDRWVSGLGLSVPEHETLDLLLSEWHEGTLADIVEAARRLT
jgi:hypothetical protein